MNSRERVLAALDRKPVDRLPTDLWATGEVMAKLRDHLGPGADVAEALGIDGFAGAGPDYQGPPAARPGADPVWGFEFTRVEYETGAYQEQTVYPLAEAASIDDLEAYRWPDPDWWDYTPLRERLQPRRAEKAVQVGYMTPFFLHNKLRGLEQSLMDPALDPDFTHHLLGRITDFVVAHHRRIFEAAGDLIDVTQVTDDLGSQTGPVMSLEMFREFYRPPIRRCIDLAKEFGIRVFHHDDGAMSQFLPDLVADGIDILNPVQHNCPGMEMAPLRETWGERLAFHGGVENQSVLPFGTPAAVRAEVRRCIDALAPERTGYMVASCHNLQAVTPVENILALYDEARAYGAS